MTPKKSVHKIKKIEATSNILSDHSSFNLGINYNIKLRKTHHKLNCTLLNNHWTNDEERKEKIMNTNKTQISRPYEINKSSTKREVHSITAIQQEIRTNNDLILHLQILGKNTKEAENRRFKKM